MHPKPAPSDYVVCVCKPQVLNARATGPSSHVEAQSHLEAAMQALLIHGMQTPGYVEVITYRPDDGERRRVRIKLELEGQPRR